MPHQIEGVEELTSRVNPERGRTLPGCLMLGDSMRMGKTKQVIDAAHVLHARGEIDRVLVATTGAGKSVWADPEFGEIRKHSWDDVPIDVTVVHQKDRTWVRGPKGPDALQWFVTNYEYLRNNDKTDRSPTRIQFKMIAGPRTVLVLDESSAVKGSKSQQTRACLFLRQSCSWVWLLNGTPLDHSPEDAFSQCLIMDPGILGVSFITHFRARFGVLEQHQNHRTGRRYFTVSRWRNLEELKRRIAPYVLRRPEHLAKLPPVLPPITITATLGDKTWAKYRELRDEFVTWADSQTVLTAAQTGVRLIRLAQMTSGFFAGLVTEETCPGCNGTPLMNDVECKVCGGSGIAEYREEPRDLGREKTDLVVDWLAERLEEEPDLKAVIWCRFRHELERLFTTMLGNTRFIRADIAKLYGGQNRVERTEALRLLHPETTSAGRPAFLIGTVSTGAMSINCSAASLAVYVSNSVFLRDRLQSEARIRMGGQTRPVQHVDVIAEGPSGQRTVDHIVVKSLREKRELVDSIVGDWVKEIR